MAVTVAWKDTELCALHSLYHCEELTAAAGCCAKRWELCDHSASKAVEAPPLLQQTPTHGLSLTDHSVDEGSGFISSRLLSKDDVGGNGCRHSHRHHQTAD